MSRIFSWLFNQQKGAYSPEILSHFLPFSRQDIFYHTPYLKVKALSQKIKTRLYENLRMLPHAPSVQMQGMILLSIFFRY